MVSGRMLLLTAALISAPVHADEITDFLNYSQDVIGDWLKKTLPEQTQDQQQPPNGDAMVTEAAPAPTEAIKFLPHGDQSLAARLLAITAAKSTIDFLTYEYAPCDSSTKLLVEALVEKADKGIKVRINLDSYSLTKTQRGQLAAFFAAHKNIEFKLFNEHGLENRSHIKMLLIDGETYFVGGRNNTDSYFGMSKTMNYFDQDLEITGPSAKTVQARYEIIWSSSYTQDSAETASAIEKQQFESNCMSKSSRDEIVANFITNNAETLTDLPVYKCSGVKYTADDPKFIRTPTGSQLIGDAVVGFNPFFEYKQTTKLFVDFVNGAEANGTLNMQNQYYAPLNSEMDSMKDARLRGVATNVETNATGDCTIGGTECTADVRIAAARDTVVNPDKGAQSLIMLISSKGDLRDTRTLSINGAPWRIHTKTAVRDHKGVFVSSFNLDTRSYMLNLESGVVIPNCPELAQSIEREYGVVRQIYIDDSKSCSADCKSEMNPGNGVPNILDALVGNQF